MASLLRHSYIYTVGRAGAAALNLLATAVYTRLATPYEYSNFVIANTVAQLVSALFFQWLRMGLIRVSRDRPIEVVVGTLGGLYLAQVFILLLISACFIPFFSDVHGGRWFLMLTLVLSLSQASFDFFQEIQRASLKPKSYTLTYLLRAIISLLLGSAVLYVTGSGYLLIVSFALALSVSPFLSIKSLSLEGLKFDRRLACEAIKYSYPLILSMGLSCLTLLGDRLLVYFIVGKEAVGIYGPASDFPRQTIVVIAQSISLAGFPLALKLLTSNGIDCALSQLKKSAQLIIYISIPLSGCIAIFSSEISGLIFGLEYSKLASQLLPVMAVGSIFMVLRMYCFEQVMQLHRSSRSLLFVNGVTFTSGLISCYMLSSYFGIIGAAYSFLIGQMVGCFSAMYLSIRCYRFEFPWKMVGKSFLSFLLAAIACNFSEIFVPSELFWGAPNMAFFAISFFLFSVAFKVDCALRVRDWIKSRALKI